MLCLKSENAKNLKIENEETGVKLKCSSDKKAVRMLKKNYFLPLKQRKSWNDWKVFSPIFTKIAFTNLRLIRQIFKRKSFFYDEQYCFKQNKTLSLIICFWSAKNLKANMAQLSSKTNRKY